MGQEIWGPEQHAFDHARGQLATEFGYGNGGQFRRFVYGPGTDEPLVWYEGSGTSDRRWLHADERGSVVAVSDASGTVTAVNTYDEHGVPGTGNVGRLQYTGQMWLPAVGLYDYKARMYAPRLGRFLQTDPIEYYDGMNGYGYVGGDPVNRSDPSGTFSICTGSLILDADKYQCGGVSHLETNGVSVYQQEMNYVNNLAPLLPGATLGTQKETVFCINKPGCFQLVTELVKNPDLARVLKGSEPDGDLYKRIMATPQIMSKMVQAWNLTTSNHREYGFYIMHAIRNPENLFAGSIIKGNTHDMGAGVTSYMPNWRNGVAADAFFHTHPSSGNYFNGVNVGDADWGRFYGIMMIVRSSSGYDHVNY